MSSRSSQNDHQALSRVLQLFARAVAEEVIQILERRGLIPAAPPPPPPQEEAASSPPPKPLGRIDQAVEEILTKLRQKRKERLEELGGTLKLELTGKRPRSWDATVTGPNRDGRMYRIFVRDPLIGRFGHRFPTKAEALLVKKRLGPLLKEEGSPLGPLNRAAFPKF